MIWLVWHFGGRPSGGFFAAVTFTLSGFFIGHAEHTPYISIAAWLPWIFGLADRAVARSHPGFALLAAGSMGTASLGGYPGLLAFTGLALVLWLILRFLPSGGQEDRPLRNRAAWVAGILCLIGLVTLIVWSPILHAFFTEGEGYTERVSPLPPDKANFGDPFSIPALLSFFFPYASILGRSLMQADISMANGYVGVFAVPLAAFWFLKGSGNRRAWWFLGFLLFMFLVSLGGKAGVRTVLYHLFPPMRYMRFSAPFRLYWILALSLAAGLGFSLLKERPETSRNTLFLLAGWAGTALAAAFLLVRFFSSHGLPVDGSLLRLFLPAMAVLPAGIAVLWLMSSSRSVPLKRAAPAFLILLVAADMAGHLYSNQETVWVRRETIHQAESFHRRSTFVRGEPGPRHPPLPFGYFNAQQVIKVPVVQGYTTMKSGGFDEVLCRSRFVEVMQSPLRFWISPGVEPVTSRESALSALAATGYGGPVPVFIEDAKPFSPLLRVAPGSYGTTRILSYAPEEIEMEIEVPGMMGGFLASTERYASGWKAWVDGVPEHVVKTNLYFRGIFVPAGKHIVRWAYKPDLWKPFVILSYASLTVSMGGALFLVFRRPRGESDDER
jgi:hypothetical protein